MGSSGWGRLLLRTLTCSAVCLSSTNLAWRCEGPRLVGGRPHWDVVGAGATKAAKVGAEEEVRGGGVAETAEQPQLDPWSLSPLWWQQPG